MGIKEELGKKIKRMRINRGLTQEQLAEAVDVSQRTLSGIEIGENFVTAETLDKIIKGLFYEIKCINYYVVKGSYGYKRRIGKKD